MAAAAVPVAVAGLALQAYGMYSSARAANTIAGQKMAAAKFEADQENQQAVQTVAASQRTAFLVDRQTQLVQSRALAVAAASGGGASDPTIMNIIANIGGEGSYKKAVALYEGEETARQLRLKAQADLISGEIGGSETAAQARSTEIGGTGAILSSGASLYAKYGYKSPGSSPGGFGGGGTLDAGTPTDSSYS